MLAKVRDQEYTDKVTTSTANLDKANASLEKATEDFKRATALIATQSITAARLRLGEARVSRRRSPRCMGAKAQLDEARMKLTYTDLVAPMNGVLLSRKIEVGSLVGPGTVGFVMADLSSVKVVFSVPDVMLAQVPLGKTVGDHHRVDARQDLLRQGHRRRGRGGHQDARLRDRGDAFPIRAAN